MTLIRPFRGLRPKPEYAKEVVAPPYDVLNTSEARARARGRPYSFLHISKPEIDLPADTDPYADEVYQTGATNLNRLVGEGILIRDASPVYYAYRLIMADHVQIGLVAIASVKDYDTNRIRKHEFTRPDKENDRVRQIDTLNAQTGPVFLTYRQNQNIDAVMKKITQGTPVYDLTADDGVQHSIWLIDNKQDIETLTESFEAMPCLYIADGHHRSAAASRVAAMRGEDGADASYNYFLAVLFPDNQMQILDYNRVLRDLNGLDPHAFLHKLAERFTVEQAAAPVKPAKPGEFGMYLGGQWYRLTIHTDCIPVDNPVGRLDVSLLQDNLISPILNITDPRRDKRIDFVGGIRGLAELEKRVNSGEMVVAFSLYATRMESLMSVADALEVMPPKSTWFEPKLADGLVSHVLD